MLAVAGVELSARLRYALQLRIRGGGVLPSEVFDCLHQLVEPSLYGSNSL